MSHELKFFQEKDFDAIYQCFREAFANYQVDMSYMTPEVTYNRFQKNAVQYDCSVGALADDKLIGFIMVGLDNFKGELAAFDAATGIVPDFQGKGIARAMLQKIIDQLQAQQVQKFYLEVLQPNEPAIKAYQKAGFEIQREFDCFKLDLSKPREAFDISPDIQIKALSPTAIQAFEADFEWVPSWENSVASILRIPDEKWVFGAFLEEKLVGYLVYYPAFQQILQIFVQKAHRRKHIASSLFAHVLTQVNSPFIKFNNIDHSDATSRALLEKLGFEFVIGQFEMMKAL